MTKVALPPPHNPYDTQTYANDIPDSKDKLSVALTMAPH